MSVAGAQPEVGYQAGFGDQRQQGIVPGSIAPTWIVAANRALKRQAPHQSGPGRNLSLGKTRRVVIPGSIYFAFASPISMIQQMFFEWYPLLAHTRLPTRSVTLQSAEKLGKMASGLCGLK